MSHVVLSTSNTTGESSSCGVRTHDVVSFCPIQTDAVRSRLQARRLNFLAHAVKFSIPSPSVRARLPQHSTLGTAWECRSRTGPACGLCAQQDTDENNNKKKKRSIQGAHLLNLFQRPGEIVDPVQRQVAGERYQKERKVAQRRNDIQHR